MDDAKKLISTAPRSDPIARWLIFISGVVGPIAFVVAFTVGGIVRPGYSPIHQAISDLGVGPGGGILDAIGFIMGLLLITFAVVFTRLLSSVVSRGWLGLISVLLALRGLGLVTTAVFTEAPATVRIHSLAALVSAFSLLGAFLIVGLALRRDPHWRRWGTYSLVACMATLVLAALEFWVFTPGTLLAPALLGGLMERAVYIETMAWYVAFGWRLSRYPAGN